MPTYEYKCEPCRVIYRVSHGMSEKPTVLCPECNAAATRMISAPNLSLGRHTSPTAAKYAKMSASEEIARERKLQETYRTIWLPPPVRENPWKDD